MGWIKRYQKSESKNNVVKVKGHGIIDLNELPIIVKKELEGLYKICWVMDGGEPVLYEVGGTDQWSFGGVRCEVKEIND